MVTKYCLIIIMNRFLFFWGHKPEKGFISSLSNWYACTFSDTEYTYSSTEQYMMYQKAILFHDLESASNIMRSDSPKVAKSLGRQVKNFDQHEWNQNCERIVYEGCLLKFSQNIELRDYLLSTGHKILVEASPYDSIWGIGLSAKDAIVIPQEQWPGKNLLGKCLMEVRQNLTE